MRKLLMGLTVLSSTVALSSCFGKETLKCTKGEETFEYKYNKDELLEYKYNGEVQEGTVWDTALAAVETAGGIDKYIENTKTNLEALGATCE